jgi:hypothetical protein
MTTLRHLQRNKIMLGDLRVSNNRPCHLKVRTIGYRFPILLKFPVS